MKSKLHLFLIFSFSLLSSKAYGARVKKGIYKSQIKTEHFNIIFDTQYEHYAQRVANNLEYLYDNIRYSLNTKIDRYDIILNGDYVEVQSQVINNPNMMEVSIMTPQIRKINYNANWIDLVPIHEARHIFQNDLYYNYGFGKLIYLTLGSPLPFNLAPKWFYEGDAVFIESLLTKGGRGRSSDFLAFIKAMVLEKNNYNYDKFYLNSSKEHQPDVYPMGFVLITYLRKKYGKDIIERIIKRQSSFPYALLTFDLAFNRETGKYPHTIYKEALNDIKKLYLKQLDGLKITETKSISNTPDEYCDYLRPHISEDDSIITMKNGNYTFSSIIKIKNGKETILKKINPHILITYPSYHYRKGLIAWSGVYCHPRWKNEGSQIKGKVKQYSDIFIYDVKKKKTTRLSKRGKYLSPNISPDGKYIVAVTHDKRLSARIVILDINTKKIIKEVKFSYGEDVSNPVWSIDGSEILFIKNYRQKNSVNSFTINDKNTKIVEVIPPSYHYIDGLHPKGRYIYYHSDLSGITNIYVLDREENRHYQVTSVKYGAYDPTVKEGSNKIFFNNYTIKGHEVAYISIDKNKWIPIGQVEDRHMNYFEGAYEQELNDKNIENIPQKKFKVTPYNPNKHLINIYAFNLWPADLDDGSIKNPSSKISYKSQNILKTLEFEGAYSYNWAKKQGLSEFSASVPGLFIIPKIKLFKANSYQNGDLSSTSDQEERSKIISQNNLESNYRGALDITPSLILPLSFNEGIYHQDIKLETGLTINWNYSNNFFIPKVYTPMGIHVSNIKPIRSSKIANYRWGQILIYRYNIPFNDNSNTLVPHESEHIIGGEVFLPGLYKTHSIQLVSIGYYDMSGYRYLENAFKSSVQIFAAGNLLIDGTDLKYMTNRTSDKVVSLYSIYELPILFPEWNMGNILYHRKVNLKLLSAFYIDFSKDFLDKSLIPKFDMVSIAITNHFNILRAKNLRFVLGLVLGYTKEKNLFPGLLINISPIRS